MRPSVPLFFFFNDTATTEIYTLSLHDALPISAHERALVRLEAVQAHRDIGKRPGEHLPLPINFVRDSRKKLYDRSGHIGPDEQVARGGMPEILVQGQHGSGRDPHVAGRLDAGPDRDVRDVLMLHR